MGRVMGIKHPSSVLRILIGALGLSKGRIGAGVRDVHI
jgi:hypothetical protein